MRAQRKSSHQLHQHPAKKKMATKSKCSIFHIIAYGRVDKLCVIQHRLLSFVVMVKTAFGLPIPIFSLCLILHMSGEI